MSSPADLVEISQVRDEDVGTEVGGDDVTHGLVHLQVKRLVMSFFDGRPVSVPVV